MRFITQFQSICKELRFVDDLNPTLRVKIEMQLNECDKFNKNTEPIADSPYTTIVHRDLWTNNIMILKGKIHRVMTF